MPGAAPDMEVILARLKAEPSREAVLDRAWLTDAGIEPSDLARLTGRTLSEAVEMVEPSATVENSSRRVVVLSAQGEK